MAATLTEIAKEAKVSVSLVSRFINNDPTLRVSEDKIIRIEEAKKRLGGVRVNRAARSLRSNLAYNFVLPLNQVFSLEWFSRNIGASEVFRSLQKILRARDFRVSVNMFDPDEQFDFIEDTISSRGYCDGLILEHGIVDEELASLILQKKFPHVNVDPRAEKYGVNTVCDYSLSGLRQAVEHLLELGHRRIGYLGTEYRYPVFLAAMAEKGVPFSENDKYDVKKIALGQNVDQYRVNAHDAFAEAFRLEDGPTAVICSNDYVALGVVDAMKEQGLTPGVDLSLIGYDNIEQRGSAPSENPILTTVDVPFDLIGKRCAEVLLDQVVNKRHYIVHEHIPSNLIIRSSTGICKQKA